MSWMRERFGIDRASRGLAIGGIALGLLLVAIVVWRTVAGGSYEVTATFDQVNGLVAGADVEAAGLKVGSVDDIYLGDDGLPRVKMSVDDDYRLKQGATANVRAFSASGEVNRFVSLTSGKGEDLPDGATLNTAQTDQPVEIDQVLSTLDPKTRARVRAALHGFNESTTGRGPDLAATLQHSAAALGNTADAVRQVNADGQSLRTLVSSGRKIVSTLATDPGTLGSTVDRLASVLNTTAAHQRELAQTAAALPGGLGSPRRALERTDASIGTLRRLVADARPGVRELVPFSRDLRPALHAARPALRQASRLISTAPANLRQIRPLLDAAEPTLKLAAPTLTSAAPVLDELRVRTPDFFSFFSNWADFTGSYDANGHAARVGIVLPNPAINNVIGPNDTGAGALAAPFVRTPGVLEGDPWTGYKSSFLGSGP
jgi:phospholipid/cholesterol/gamma-HCH transport system substrate-binding protein